MKWSFLSLMQHLNFFRLHLTNHVLWMEPLGKVGHTFYYTQKKMFLLYTTYYKYNCHLMMIFISPSQIVLQGTAGGFTQLHLQHIIQPGLYLGWLTVAFLGSSLTSVHRIMIFFFFRVAICSNEMLEFPDSLTTKHSDDTFLANDNGKTIIFLIRRQVQQDCCCPHF